MKPAAFHPAGDRDELAGDVAGQLAVRNTIVREIRSTCAGSSRPARHRRVRPAGRDGIHSAQRRDPDDLVLLARAREQKIDAFAREARVDCLRVVSAPCAST
jgi:hypothetical protein